MKKTLITALSFVVVAALAITGTFAWLTDRDSDVNVFTWGNVDITLNEDFEQGATLVPGKVIEKDVTVTNSGKSDAWVWVKIAMPAVLDNEDASKNVIHFNYTAESVAAGLWNWMDTAGAWNVAENVDIDGVKYNVYTVVYDTVLTSGATTAHSAMSQVYLDTTVDIDPEGNLHKVVGGNATAVGWNINDDGLPMIYVSAYATQAEGFATAAEAYAAYKTQWGANGEEYGEPIGIIEDNADLDEAITDLAGGSYLLKKDLTADEYEVADNVAVDIDLSNNTITGELVNKGELSLSNGTVAGDYVENYGKATYTDVKMTTGTPSDYASISVNTSETEYNDVEIVSGGGGIAAADGAQVVFNSGSVAVNSASTSGRYVFYAEGNGSMITINGGTFSFSKTLNQKRAYVCAQAGTTVIINGGTFGPASTRSGYTAGIMGSGTVIIKGGTFGFDPTNWVADGYEAVKTGTTWTVSAI